MIVTHGNGLLISAIFWGAIVLIVFLGNFFSYRERTSRHRMIETLAEKGQTIPPDILAGSGGRDYSYRYSHPVQSGIYLMGIGIALAIFFWAMTGGYNFFGGTNIFDGHEGPSWLPFVGIFPFMMGLSRLIAGLLDRPKSK